MGCGISNKSDDLNIGKKVVKPEPSQQALSLNVLLKYETEHNVYKIKLKRPSEDLT